MAQVLAYTNTGVETVSVLDRPSLDNLARWLCQEDSYHDRHDAFYASKNANDSDTFAVFEREKRNNGGYCDSCRDYAGKILASFDIRCIPESEAAANVRLGAF
jgi:hypothetical protein